MMVVLTKLTLTLKRSGSVILHRVRGIMRRAVVKDAVERGALDAEENHAEEKELAAVEEDKYIINLNLIYIYAY